MSLNSTCFRPAPGPGTAEQRFAAAERERATLAFQATYAAAVARKRRLSATRALDPEPGRTGAWIDGNSQPPSGWRANPEPEHARSN